MVELFGRDMSVISRHLRNVFDSKELARKSVVAKNATTAADGKPCQLRNLDDIQHLRWILEDQNHHVNPNAPIDWSLITWEGSRRAQLRRWCALTLRERLRAVEGMVDLARHFA